MCIKVKTDTIISINRYAKSVRRTKDTNVTKFLFLLNILPRVMIETLKFINCLSSFIKYPPLDSVLIFMYIDGNLTHANTLSYINKYISNL